MRIFITSVCCTVVFLPISGLKATANTTEELPQQLVSLNTQTASDDRQNTAIAKQDYLAQNQWTTDSASLEQIAQGEEAVADSSWTDSDANSSEAEEVRFKLQELSNRNFSPSRGAPSLTIANPYGFGADRGFYSSFSYQNETRYTGGDSDATMGFGFGVGDATKAVGAELSYTVASFGNNRDFGSGGFNAKIHRQLGNSWGVAAGWNSFLSLGDDNDLEDSLYLVTTKIFKTRENLNSAFSRVAATVGVGNGQFRSEEAIDNEDEQFNVFGSLAFRVAPPVSFVTEWTGQDLALGVSASPFRNIPVTINLGVRDLTGAGDGARFIAGIGTAF